MQLSLFKIFFKINLKQQRVLVFIVSLFVFLSVTICSANEQITVQDVKPNGRILRVVGWDVYSDPMHKDKTIGYKEFEKKFNIIIHFTPLNHLDDIINTVESNNNYDVIIISNEGINSLNKMELIEPLDLDNIPNYQNLYPSLQNNNWIQSKNSVYAVPWAWGPTGLLYDADVIDEPESWNILWDPKYKGQVSLWDDISMIWVTALSLGYKNVYNLTRQQLSEVKRKLLDLNSQVYGYYPGGDQAMHYIRKNDVIALNSWFDPSARLRKEGRNFKMSIPKEGAVGMFDSYLISSRSKNINIAHDFINYQISPNTQKKMTHITGLAPTNSHTINNLTSEEIKLLHLNETGYFERMYLWNIMPRKHLYEEVLKEVRDDFQKKVKSINKLKLSKAEQDWLKLNPIITFTGDPNWLPYEAFDEQGNYIGIVAEHLNFIKELTGLKIKINPSKTWSESTEKAKQGSVDILSETNDSDLKSHLKFTSPYITNPIIITMRNNENYVESINNIRDKKIALIKDYGYTAKIRRKYSNIKFITVNDIHDGLIAVSTGEIDALLCTLALCSYTISELGLNNVKIIGKTEFNTKLAFGIQKNLPELLSIFNKAINKITPRQQKNILDVWIKEKVVKSTDYTLVYQIILIAVMLLGIFIFWNRRLSREINLRNISEKELKSAQEVLKISHQRLLLHSEQTPLAVIEWNTDFEFLDWNKSAERIFGYTKEEVIGRHITERILPDSAGKAVDILWKNLLENKGGERSTNENITQDGRIILCEWYNTPLVDQQGKVIGVSSLVDDVTDRKLSEEMIWNQAHFDSLTGLPNRNMFRDRLLQEVSKSNRTKRSLALFFIDLDEFKDVNDTLGHEVGDKLLQETGKRIRSCVRESDTVARLGGDEFTIILSDLHEDHIHDLASTIINKLSEEYLLGEELIHISASIGITLYPNDANDIDGLIKNADQAMYAAKKQGRNRFSYFTQSLQETALNKLRLRHDLRIALHQNQFEIYFQPIVDLNTDRIYKAEALLRWHHPERGMVSPIEFISIAEETGLINKIGNWVFKESVQWAKKWSSQFENNFQISVNMSPVQFKIENNIFTKEWLDYLHETGLPGQNIVVEITEGLLLNVGPEVTNKLLWLRDRGIQVAIDDFGTGYSSLSYLNKFDIDYLKIDQSFVRHLETDSNNIALSEAIIVMAHKLGLKVIAEGVETKAQKELLTSAGCDYAQGYLYSKPVPSDEFEALLRLQKKDEYTNN